MMRQLFLILALAFGLSALGTTAFAQRADGTTEAPSPLRGDQAPMYLYATMEAQRTLPMFLDRLDRPNPDPDDMLKVAIPTPSGGIEDIWVAQLRRDGDGFTGAIANVPVAIEVRVGDRVSFTREQITDWGYWSDDVLWGSYTARVMLQNSSPAAARRLRAMLSPTPTEDGVPWPSRTLIIK